MKKKKPLIYRIFEGYLQTCAFIFGILFWAFFEIANYKGTYSIKTKWRYYNGKR